MEKKENKVLTQNDSIIKWRNDVDDLMESIHKDVVSDYKLNLTEQDDNMLKWMIKQCAEFLRLPFHSIKDLLRSERYGYDYPFDDKIKLAELVSLLKDGNDIRITATDDKGVPIEPILIKEPLQKLLSEKCEEMLLRNEPPYYVSPADYCKTSGINKIEDIKKTLVDYRELAKKLIGREKRQIPIYGCIAKSFLSNYADFFRGMNKTKAYCIVGDIIVKSAIDRIAGDYDVMSSNEKQKKVNEWIESFENVAKNVNEGLRFEVFIQEIFCLYNGIHF